VIEIIPFRACIRFTVVCGVIERVVSKAVSSSEAVIFPGDLKEGIFWRTGKRSVSCHVAEVGSSAYCI
jgi:hypothetical protein